jgi:formiminotetrahydrofolate cyclodeaminase
VSGAPNQAQSRPYKPGFARRQVALEEDRRWKLTTNEKKAEQAPATGELTLNDFLDALASNQPMPGGGAAAAICGAQAAALVSMVINFTLGNKKYAAVEAEMRDYLRRSEALRAEIAAVADRDIDAFNAVAACYRMPRTTDEEKAARSAALQIALKGATEVPFMLAGQCIDLLQLIEKVGAKGNANVVSDAATALHLARAAFASALVNIDINLKSLKDAEFVAESAARRARLVAQMSGAYELARSACEQTLEISL